MPKPDYVVTKVEYDEDHSYIQKVRRHEYDPTDGEVRNDHEITREELMDAVQDGVEHYTAPRDAEGQLRWGGKIEVLEISEHEYVRSDGNPVRQDNLGDIEEWRWDDLDEDAEE